MRLKNYLAASMTEAINQVKEELRAGCNYHFRRNG